jgi:hypothetical protein
MVNPSDALAILEGRLNSPMVNSPVVNSPMVRRDCLLNHAEHPERRHTTGGGQVLTLPDDDALRGADELVVMQAGAPGRDNALDAAASEDGVPSSQNPSLPLPFTPLVADMEHIPTRTFDCLVVEGDELAEQLSDQHPIGLLTEFERGSTPVAQAVRCHVHTPDDINRERRREETITNPTQSLDRLLVEAEVLAQQLPDQHLVELLTALERGSTPVSQAVRSRVNTPDVLRREHSAGRAVQEIREKIAVPTLDVNRAHLDQTTEAVLAVLTNRSSRAMSLLQEEGKKLLQHLDLDLCSDVTSILISLSHTNPIASVLFSAMLQAGFVGGELQAPNALEDENRLQDFVDDASSIFSMIQDAVTSGEASEQRETVLKALQEMTQDEGEGNFVARMLYLDLMATCRSIAEGTDGSMSQGDKKEFESLVVQGSALIGSLEERHALSILDSISAGAAANRYVLSV